ncbi:MAG TPA: hypothetical protein VLE49_10020 [Anaerolineales bacterium]|nr:hypothetical protein [Anaerolineales bacterium]
MKRYQPKLFALIAATLIAIQVLTACAPAASTSTAPSVSTQPPTSPTAGIPQTGATEAPSAMPTETAMNTGQTDPLVFQQTMRKLWEDHITWTRVYIISAVAGLPDSDAAAQRLLKNQEDIGNAIKPFYGDEAGNQLTALLKTHITTAVDILNAAKAGDNAKLDAAKKSWEDNANQIADFLNKANPDNWPLSDLQSMMKSHLDLTLEEATARLKGDWPSDVAAYDKVHEEILMMADALSQGIIKQFPDKFSEQMVPQKQIDSTLAMNKLWEDHVQWTRYYIVSAAGDLPDKDATAQRLLKNQEDLGDAIKTYYGDDAGNQLTTLLKAHITTAVDILNAAKAGDNAKLDTAKKSWYDNADQIATFLSGANPDNWPESAVKDMMKSHLDLTLDEATARLKTDWTGDVAAYDKVHDEILMMAGTLTKGIVAQFPDKFK